MHRAYECHCKEALSLHDIHALHRCAPLLHGLAFLDCKGFAICASIGPLGMRSTSYLSALHCRICVTSALICLRAHGLTLYSIWYCLCGKMTLQAYCDLLMRA